MSDNNSPTPSTAPKEVPRGTFPEAMKYFRNDLVSGFLVFLIALPLCLAISVSSGYPPIAGIFTAIIGAIVTTFISNSELTIKGPAAGLIVIALGCINEFGGAGNPDAYRAALAVGVAAAVLQILFGMFRAGILAEFFPISVVQGMLAAIGVIIIIKQIPYALGIVGAKGSPLGMVQQIPQYIHDANPAIATIGIVSLIIMFVWPKVGKKLGPLKLIPAPMIVLLVAVPMGMRFDLLHEHSYYLQGQEYQLSDQYLVDMPDRVFGMFDEVTYPEFSALGQLKAWKWVLMFFVIGSLESLLSAKAVDLLDPWRRKTNMDRDVIAIGAGNLCASLVGGLLIISEIVRSKANIDNGARTRFADMWHGFFLLICVAMIPTVLHQIPLAALAAMLVYTGFRLAHPTEFIHVYRIGKEQLAIFAATLIVVLATDLMIGVAAGIVLKMVIHISNGVQIRSLFKPYLEVEDVDENTSMIFARQSAVFSNWIPFRRQIEDIGLVQHRNLIIDVSDTKLVDHSVMGKLQEMARDFEQEGLTFEVRGLESLQPLADNAQAARKRGLASIRRITVMANQSLRYWLLDEFVKCGATGFTVTTCTGAGRRNIENDCVAEDEHVRIEVIVPEKVCEAVIDFLRRDILPDHHVEACVETVDVVRVGHFASVEDRPANPNYS